MPTEIGEISAYQNCMDVIINWKISDFSNLPRIKHISYISPEFFVNTERWCLKIQPYVYYQMINCVDLYLWKRASNSSITQAFSFALKNVFGEKRFEKCCTKLFTESEAIHGIRPFVSRSEITLSWENFMSNGYLIVVCTMKNSKTAESASKSLYD